MDDSEFTDKLQSALHERLCDTTKPPLPWDASGIKLFESSMRDFIDDHELVEFPIKLVWWKRWINKIYPIFKVQYSYHWVVKNVKVDHATK